MPRYSDPLGKALKHTSAISAASTGYGIVLTFFSGALVTSARAGTSLFPA